MKRWLILLLCLMMWALPACADEIQLEEMTQAELLELRAAIDARLIAMEMNTVLYDQNGILVTWCGIEKKPDSFDGGYEYQVDLMISNNSGEDIVFDLPVIAINGFVIGKTNDMSKTLDNGLSVMTAATNICFFDDGILKDSNIEQINDVRGTLRLRTAEKKLLAEIDFASTVAESTFHE